METTASDQVYYAHELCTYYDTFAESEASKFYNVLAYSTNDTDF